MAGLVLSLFLPRSVLDVLGKVEVFISVFRLQCFSWNLLCNSKMFLETKAYMAAFALGSREIRTFQSLTCFHLYVWNAEQFETENCAGFRHFLCYHYAGLYWQLFTGSGFCGASVCEAQLCLCFMRTSDRSEKFSLLFSTSAVFFWIELVRFLSQLGWLIGWWQCLLTRSQIFHDGLKFQKFSKYQQNGMKTGLYT